MSFIVSTGLRHHLLVTGSLKAGLDGGVIRIYSGTVPIDGDAAIAGGNTLLCTISDDAAGTGITLDGTPSGGVITKDVTEVWRGVNAATGTASFFRFSALADALGSSTSEKRLQGTCGVLNADLLLASVSLVATEEQRIDSAAFGMPSS